MKKKKTLLISFALIPVFIFSMAALPSAASSDALAEGENLLQNRCTSCHGAAKITRAKKDKNGWERTVRRMEQKGVKLTDAERTLLLDYLATAYGK